MNRPRLREVLVLAAAFMLGSLIAFLLVGPAVFADGATSERVLVLGMSVLAFALAGAALSAIAPRRWRLVAWILVLPVLPVALLLGLDSEGGGLLVLATAFVVGDLAAALFGAWAGASAVMTRSAE